MAESRLDKIKRLRGPLSPEDESRVAKVKRLRQMQAQEQEQSPAPEKGPIVRILGQLARSTFNMRTPMMALQGMLSGFGDEAMGIMYPAGAHYGHSPTTSGRENYRAEILDTLKEKGSALGQDVKAIRPLLAAKNAVSLLGTAANPGGNPVARPDVEAYRQKMQENRTNHPLETLYQEALLGSALPIFPTSVAKNIAQLPLTARLARAAGHGAVGGAVSGLGEGGGETGPSRLRSAAEGAVAGGIFGPAAYGATAALHYPAGPAARALKGLSTGMRPVRAKQVMVPTNTDYMSDPSVVERKIKTREVERLSDIGPQSQAFFKAQIGSSDVTDDVLRARKQELSNTLDYADELSEKIIADDITNKDISDEVINAVRSARSLSDSEHISSEHMLADSMSRIENALDMIGRSTRKSVKVDDVVEGEPFTNLEMMEESLADLGRKLKSLSTLQTASETFKNRNLSDLQFRDRHKILPNITNPVLAMKNLGKNILGLQDQEGERAARLLQIEGEKIRTPEQLLRIVKPINYFGLGTAEQSREVVARTAARHLIHPLSTSQNTIEKHLFSRDRATGQQVTNEQQANYFEQQLERLSTQAAQSGTWNPTDTSPVNSSITKKMLDVQSRAQTLRYLDHRPGFIQRLLNQFNGDLEKMWEYSKSKSDETRQAIQTAVGDLYTININIPVSEDMAGKLRAGGNGFARGVSKGFSDEIEAFIRSQTTGEDYGEALTDARSRYFQNLNNYPFETGMGDDVGTLIINSLPGFAGVSGAAQLGARAGLLGLGVGGRLGEYGQSQADRTRRNRAKTLGSTPWFGR